LSLQDGASDLGVVTYTFYLPRNSTFSNTAAITIPDHGIATPYPSTIEVSGLTGLVSKVTVTLSGLSHSFPRDVNALLTSPNGSRTLLMAHAGGAHAVTNLNLTFDDPAGVYLPSGDQIVTGTYAPTNYSPLPSFPAPALPPPYSSALAAFNASDPTGTW